MDADYHIDYESVTEEYVLAVLQDACGPWSSDSPALRFTTTICQWRNDAFDLPGWRRLARILNKWWDIRCSNADWYAVLEPARQRCLGEVCRLIASHARRPKIRPARLLGRECVTAGAFLTVRALLCQAGAAADEITPSTVLSGYLRRYQSVFQGPIARLGPPGVLPPPEYDSVAWRYGGWLVAVCMVAIGILTILSWLGAPILVLLSSFAVPLLIVGLVLWPLLFLIPERIRLGNLETFRDLAVTLVGDGRH